MVAMVRPSAQVMRAVTTAKLGKYLGEDVDQMCELGALHASRPSIPYMLSTS